MDKQRDFVLRTIEERGQVRQALVHRRRRHPEVGRDRAGRGRGRVHRGHRLRRLGDRGTQPHVRIRPARVSRPDDLPDAAVARRHRSDRAHVLRHHDARRRTGRRRPPQRAQAHAGARRRPRLHVLHAPRDRVLPAQVEKYGPEGPQPVDSAGYFDNVPGGTAHDFRRGARSACWKTSASRSSSATTRPVPARTRSTCATPTRPHDRRQHHDLPHRRERGRDRAGRLRDLHAEAVLALPARACTRTSRSSRATPTPSTNRARSTSSRRSAGSSSRGCCATPTRSRRSRTSSSTRTSACGAATRRRASSAGGTTTGPRSCACRSTSRTRARALASSTARSTPAANPYLASRSCSRRA